MAEPIPSATNAADAADDEQAQNLPNNAEDRKAAAALNSLNANAMSQENGESAAKPSAADQEALGKAMSRLEIASGGIKKSDGAKKPEQKKDAEPKKKIKISSEDVTFLVRVPFPDFASNILTAFRLRSLTLPRTRPQSCSGLTRVMLRKLSKLSSTSPFESRNHWCTDKLQLIGCGGRQVGSTTTRPSPSHHTAEVIGLNHTNCDRHQFFDDGLVTAHFDFDSSMSSSRIASRK